MIDGVEIPAGGCLRPLDLQRPSRPCWPGGRVDAGAGRKSICVTMGRGARGYWRGSGGSLDRLPGLVELDGGERLLAELTQDVVGAAAELARNRETGAVVVDPLAHLAEVGVVGGGAASGRLGCFEQRPAQHLRPLVREVARRTLAVRLVDGHVEACVADGVVGARETAAITELGQDRRRGDNADAVELGDQRSAAGLAARERASSPSSGASSRSITSSMRSASATSSR